MKTIAFVVLLLFSVYTHAQDASDQPLGGIRLPANFSEFAEQQNNQNRTKAEKIKKQIEKFGSIVDSFGNASPTQVARSYCKVDDAAYDARSQNLVTPVRDQGRACQACWAFVTAELMESAELAQSGHSTALSTQEVLSCSNYGSCAGGQGIPLDWLSQSGLVADVTLPYNPHTRNVACQALKPIAHIKSAGFLRDKGDLPATVDERKQLLKQGLCDHGTLGVFMSATNGLLNAGSSVYINPQPERTTDEVNHLVELIGWDDASNAWLIKNSYGDGVGQQGYFKVGYASQWFGYGASWIEALDEPFLLLHKDLIELKPQYQKASRIKRATSPK
jgi:C1A family cysteine protease